MATIPLAVPKVITPNVDLEELAKYVDGRVRTVQDLVSKHPQIADNVLRYRTGEPLNPKEAQTAIDAAERYANEAYAQNHQLEKISRRDLIGGAFLGAFVPVVGSNTGTTSTAKANYLPRREFLRRASLLGAALGAGYLSRGAQIINPARAALLLTALAAGVSQTACTIATVEGNKLGKDMGLEERLHQYLKYVDAAIKAGTWDKVYGPSLSRHALYGHIQDFEGHKLTAIKNGKDSQGAGSVDYDVPKGTPVVAIHLFYCHEVGNHYIGGLFVRATYTLRNTGVYSHLSDILIKEGQQATRGTIIGLSGDTGEGFRKVGISMPEHLDLALYERGKVITPVNPFNYGEEGGKPKFLTDKNIDKGYVGIRDVFDEFVNLYTGHNKQAFSGKMLEHLIKTKDSNNLLNSVSENPSLFQRDAYATLLNKRIQWMSQQLRAITLPFPSIEIVKKQLEDSSLSPGEWFYHLPNAVNKF